MPDEPQNTITVGEVLDLLATMPPAVETEIREMMQRLRTNRDPDRTAAKRIHELCAQQKETLKLAGFDDQYFAYLLEYIVTLQQQAGQEQVKRALRGFYDGEPRLN